MRPMTSFEPSKLHFWRSLMFRRRCRYFFYAPIIQCAIGVHHTLAVAVVTVPVGNPGNPADTEIMTDATTGYGSVPYSYRLGKYETTAGQYTEFLNAVADTDTYGLYNTAMSDPAFDPAGCNIQ